MDIKLAVRLLNGVEVATDVIDLLQVFLWVHVGKTTVLILVDFADNLLD